VTADELAKKVVREGAAKAVAEDTLETGGDLREAEFSVTTACLLADALFDAVACDMYDRPDPGERAAAERAADFVRLCPGAFRAVWETVETADGVMTCADTLFRRYTYPDLEELNARTGIVKKALLELRPS